MCGIAGGVFWDGRTDRTVAAAAVRRMTDALAHRGPDGRGLMESAYTDSRAPFAVFGHTRLAILDVSARGAQPMGDPSSSFITYNGETYNFAALARDLSREGDSFASQSDTEVLLRGYRRWGADIVERAQGMFAFAVWDAARHRLLLARDRLGIKPLYYFAGNGHLLFASEVRALLASDLVPRQLDAEGLWGYLGYQSVPWPRTLVAGVKALGAGCVMTVEGDGTRAEREYWRLLDRAGTRQGVSGPEAQRLVGDALRDAVSSHMVSDVPVGAFLSGGIDSSAVVALMRESGATPRTFSVGFTEQAFDESVYAEEIAHRFSTHHTHVPLSSSQLLDALPASLRAMDQPTGDGINSYVVSAAVRAQGLAVAQSGLGGDEVFGGYPSFERLTRIEHLAGAWGHAPQMVRSAAARLVRSVGGTSVSTQKAADVVESNGSVAEMYPLLRQLFSAEQRRDLLGPAKSGWTDPYTPRVTGAASRHPRASTFDLVSWAESSTYMHDVLLRDTDQMSMAHALEVRVPLLDHRLVELVVSLPDAVKASGPTPKPLLVQALGHLLPESIVQRPKQGFTLPFDPWLRGPLRPWCEARLGPQGLAGRGLIAPHAVQQLWNAFLEGKSSVSWSRIWTLAVLDAWLDRHPLDAPT